MFDKSFLKYSLKFIVFFCLLYFGTKAWIGITNPGNYYWPFAKKHLDYIACLRQLLLYGSKLLLYALGHQTIVDSVHTLQMKGGRAIHIVYSCLGYGVLSFWISFILANKGNIRRKTLWILGGGFVICLVNIIRISLLLIAINNKWPKPFWFDHHTFFNITAYICIFIMIFFFERSEKLNREIIENTKEENINTP